jgi:hypothetical protein
MIVLNEAPHHPDCPATDGFGCHCDELWEQEIYDDDYPVEDPPPSAADADRAARAWEADRLTRGEP